MEPTDAHININKSTIIRLSDSREIVSYQLRCSCSANRPMEINAFAILSDNPVR